MFSDHRLSDRIDWWKQKNRWRHFLYKRWSNMISQFQPQFVCPPDVFCEQKTSFRRWWCHTNYLLLDWMKIWIKQIANSKGYFFQSKIGRWFQLFCIFTPTCGRFPILTNIFSDGYTGGRFTLPKFNIHPAKWWLEDYFPESNFSGASCLNFGGFTQPRPSKYWYIYQNIYLHLVDFDGFHVG